MSFLRINARSTHPFVPPFAVPDDFRPARLKRMLGGLRRMFLLLFRPAYVRNLREKRRGACRRCGACCRMSWTCRHLFFFEDGRAGCRIYGEPRPWICRSFPIDERDLADRNGVSPDRACGFWWERDSHPEP